MKQSNTNWVKPFHAVPNEIAVPSPFGIYRPKEKLGYHKEPLVVQYGNIEMRISGRELNTKDQDTFIALSEIATERKRLKFKTSINELCRKLNRPYAKTSKDSIRNSLRRLREALVETVSFNKDDKKEENWIIHGMITLAAGGRFDELVVELDSCFNRLFGKRYLMTLFDTRFRLTLKGNVSKHLYIFYQRQMSGKQRPTYKIGIEKLCDLIGLDINERLTLPAKRYQIKKGHQELSNKGYLKSFSLQSNDVLFVRFDKQWTKDKKQVTRSKAETAEPEPAIKKPEQKNDLEFIKKELGIKIEKNREQVEENITRINAIGKVLGNNRFLNEFVSWLKEQRADWLKTIHASTLNPEGKVFNSFMGYMGHEMPSSNAIDKKFKLLTETPIEKEERIKKEEERELKKEQEEQEKQADIKWAEDYAKNNLIGLRHKEVSRIKDMINHGKNWKESFKEFVQAVRKKHKSGNGARDCSYIFLFRAGSRLWDDIFGLDESDELDEPEIEEEDLIESSDMDDVFANLKNDDFDDPYFGLI